MPTQSEDESRGDGKGPRWIGDNLPSLPPELQYAQDLPPKVTEKYVFFFGFDRSEPECCLQQWYPSLFAEEDPKTGQRHEFKTSEQYMMYHKALLMNDTEVAEQILETQTPAEAKHLGRQVKNFKQEIWDAEGDRVVEQGQYLKFAQNKDLKQVLLGTGKREIVETSPNDRIWGIGFNTEEAEGRESEWGDNRLGKALMKARARLQDE